MKSDFWLAWTYILIGLGWGFQDYEKYRSLTRLVLRLILWPMLVGWNMADFKP